MMTLRHGSQGRRTPMTDSSKRFEFLRSRYARSLVSKHAVLAEAWRAFADTADERNARSLQILVHRLTGSAPAYGYAELGARAGAVDRELADWDETEPSARDSPGELARRLSAPMQALIESLAHHAAAAPDDSRS